MQYANDNITDYLVRFRNAHKVNEACNEIVITRGVQEHRTKILLPFHTNEFDLLQENENKETETAGEEMLYAIIYTQN